jgi:flavin reductase (DIM6/NTAB) family NADH-FMN oxidoreductase RutF
MIIEPSKLKTAQFHGYLLGAVAPRPISFASTVDKNGTVNLSPYSFFNAFGSNPPTLIFSPARRVRDNSTKHTLDNVLEHPEVAINIVSYDIVEQMSLSSTEYQKGVNEFTKAGFTEAPSQMIKPPRVQEAKVSFECKVSDVISLGEQGGAGNLIVCEVLLMHIDDEILDENGKIDPFKLDAVGRLGGDWYVRASGSALFEVAKPLRTMGIGVDNIPTAIRDSEILTGNDLGKLGNVEKLPDQSEIDAFASEPEVSAILEYFPDDPDARLEELHKLAKEYLAEGQVDKAWKTLLQF